MPKGSELQRLQITGGLCRGRKLRVPGTYLRPMMAKVREALFSMLASTGVLQETARMLDLFSGSGIVGLEALSRGVGSATFVDSSVRCTATIRENCELLGFAARSQTLRLRAEQVLAAPEAVGLACPLDLVTLTPPYEEVDYAVLLKALVTSPVLGQDTILVVEYPTDIGLLPPALDAGRLIGLRNRVYGRTVLAMYVCQPTGRLQLSPRREEFAAMDIAD